MRQAMIVLSILLFLVGSYLGVKSIHLVYKDQHDREILSQKIQQTQVLLDGISLLPKMSLGMLEDNYRHLHERLRTNSHLADFKWTMVTLSLNESGSIEASGVPSRFMGINKIEMKITFSNVNQLHQSTGILKSLSILESEFPIEIKSIENFDRTIVVAIDLFGMPNARRA